MLGVFNRSHYDDVLRASFVRPAPQRARGDLTRQRTHLVQERASVVNRM
jgi:transposase